LKRFSTRFIAVTPVHAELTCTARIVTIADGLATLELEIVMADGTTVVRGEAELELT
jgi:hypothetical protein